MRFPARIESWLSTQDLQVWVREAPDKSAYQRRLAIWLTAVGRLAAHRVAELLCVSKQAVWLWIAQYNQQGSQGLHRTGRGGRRWAWLSWEQEERFLQERQEAAGRGQILTAPQLRAGLEKFAGRRVSLAYVYRLLHRHDWRKLGPRPRHPKAQPAVQERFKKTPPDPPKSAEAASAWGPGALAVSRRSAFRLH
jgi:transposase